MPDFTIQIMSQCKKLSQSHDNVGGYEQHHLGSERSWPTCSCPAYKFAKRTINFGGRMVPRFCKHIEQALKSRCQWHELTAEIPQFEKGVCPLCGGETESVQVAV